MLMLLQLLNSGLGIASFVCFIMVVVKFFQNGKVGLGVTCIVTLFVCGVGSLIALIAGWMSADELDARRLMGVWTLIVILNISLSVLAIILGGLQGLALAARGAAGLLI